ncbi:hypothetical protein Esti_004998 [Eimeria stiedai]
MLLVVRLPREANLLKPPCRSPSRTDDFWPAPRIQSAQRRAAAAKTADGAVTSVALAAVTAAAAAVKEIRGVMSGGLGGSLVTRLPTLPCSLVSFYACNSAAGAAAASVSTPLQGFLHQQHRGLKFVHPRNWILQWKLRPGDQASDMCVLAWKSFVMVISGQWKSRIGRILQVDKMRNAIAIEGVKERLLKDSEGREVRVAGLIHVSNAMLLDPLTEKPTRLALRRDEKGLPVRISRRTGVIVPWPDASLVATDVSRGSVEYLRAEQQQQQRQRQRDMDTALPGPKDTSKEKALERSYDYAKEVATMDAIRHMMTNSARKARPGLHLRSLLQLQQEATVAAAASAAGAASCRFEAAAALLHMVLPFGRWLTPFPAASPRPKSRSRSSVESGTIGVTGCDSGSSLI